MSKNILFTGSPQQGAVTEAVGAVYPESLTHQDNGQLILAAKVVVPYSPATGGFVMPTLYNIATVKEESQRTPTVFKTLDLTAAAGSTAVWTPSANKRFRVLGGVVNVPNTSTSAAGLISRLLDGATNFANIVAIGTTTAGISYTLSFGENGYLSTAVGNVLNVNNTAAYTAGGIVLSVWGTEE
jgi:hypothetical protein